MTLYRWVCRKMIMHMNVERRTCTILNLLEILYYFYCSHGAYTTVYTYWY